MATLTEMELEALPELESEMEGELELPELEGEGELEFEFEGEGEGGFLGSLAGLASQALGGLLSEGEGELEFEGEGEVGLHEFEGEGELELPELEMEGELSPTRRAYADALMEHLAHAAAETENEAEAEAFIGALLPLAARAAPMIMRAAPQLIRGLSRVGRLFRGRRRTRPLVRMLPTIARNTVRQLARPTSAGRPRRVTPQIAVRTLRQQTRQVLRNPRRAVQVYRRSRALDRRFHRAAVVVNIGPVYARR
jgi:hypothetical protein